MISQTGRDHYKVVEVSPSTGARIFGPVTVATMIDGYTDYPIAFGRQTYEDSLFRTWAAGNITADPTNASHLAVVWSDMRNSPTPAPADPYAATTNSDVIVSQSFDRGRTWSAPVALALDGDQFMPWGAYDSRRSPAHRFVRPAVRRGESPVRLQPCDRKRRRHARLHDQRADDGPVGSDERQPAGSRPRVNPAFPNATTFLGDYSNIAAVPSGGIVAYWTDLRKQACFLGTCGHGQDAFFAAAP